MQLNPACVDSLLDEYQALVEEAAVQSSVDSQVDWDRLRDLLIDAGEWTDDGALAVLQLSRTCGSFLLRNALALSLALGIEDGECGI